MSLLQNKAVHGVGGLILMGGWAFFANRKYEMPEPLIAAIVQGLLTALITLFLKQIIETIFRSTAGLRRLILPPLSAFLTSIMLLTSIHSTAGTPALLATISVPVTVSTLYALLYTLALSRHA